MSLPVFFPPVRYVPFISDTSWVTLEDLCQHAGERCEAVGAWTQRKIVIKQARDQPSWIKAEPGDWGAVEIGAPELASSKETARWALGALAFVLFDGVARATLLNKPWARIAEPRGRKPQIKRPMTSLERQRKMREKALLAHRRGE